MRTRKPCKALTLKQVTFHYDAWIRASRMGLALNILVTVRPANVDRLTTEQRCRIFLRIKKNYTEFARRNGFEPTFIWTRENNPNNTGEHLHMLCHAPVALVSHLMNLTVNWLPGATEIDARRASQAIHYTPTGKVRSAITYILKQMSTQTTFARPYTRQRGGLIVGDRCGASFNLRKAPTNLPNLPFRGKIPSVGGYGLNGTVPNHHTYKATRQGKRSNVLSAATYVNN